MKKLLSIILGFSVLITSLSLAYYFVIFLPQKEKARLERENLKLAQQQGEKERNQKMFDKCISRAEYEYIREERDMCWVYNHDAIGCDLNYFVSSGLKKEDELPIPKFKKAIVNCENKYPAENRTYSSTSPDFQSSLQPIGNISEREAVRKIMELQEFKDFNKPPFEKGYILRYSVDLPIKNTPYWHIHIYKDSPEGNEITLNYYKVDASNGNISVEKN